MLKIITRVWLPKSLGGLATWFANFDLKFAQFAAALGLAGEVANVGKWNTTVQWLNDADTAMKANAKGFNQFRDETLFAGKGDPAAADPVTGLPTPPDKFETSVIVKLTELVDKVEAADAYTDEMGVQLGIVKTPGDPISPGSVKPVIEAASPAATGYSFTLVISGRGDSTSADVLIRRSGSETLTKVDTFTGKSCDVTLTPTTPGVPEKLQVIIQLKKKNEDYGQPSDAVSVTVNP